MRLKRIFLLSSTLLFMLSSCTVEKEEAGEMPEIDLEVKGGEMPEYNVDWATVNVSTRKKIVKVPKVVVVMKEEEIEVPYIDMDMPDGVKTEEKTINVEVDVTGMKRELEIEEVYMSDNNLYIISELENEGELLQDQVVRVSDRIIINVPRDEDLNIKHYIIGDEPKRRYNSNYKFINSKSAIEAEIANAKQII